MDPTTLTLILACMGIIALMIYVLPVIKKWAKDKGINVSDSLVTTNKIIEILQLLMNESKILLVDQQILVDNIVEIIQSAIKLTQKMYENGECLKEERADKAIELTFEMVKVANITVTNDQHEVVVKAVKMLMLLIS